MGRSGARHFTTSHRVVNRASWSRRQAGRLLWGWLLTALLPPAATSGLGADDTGERRAGRRSTAPGGDRAAVRSRQQHGRRGGGRNGGAMLRLVPGPWRQRGGAWPCLTALCWPAQPGGRRRHKIRRDWGRQLRQPGRRWRPGPRLVVVVDGGGAAGALALAGVTHPVGLVSRRRGEAALSHPPAPQPPGTRGRQPPKGPRQRRLHAWAHRRDTPGETVAVDGAGGHRTPWWGCSPTARGSPPRRAPGGHTLWAGGGPGGATAPGSRLLSRAVGHPRGELTVGRQALVRRGALCRRPGPARRGDATAGGGSCHRAYPP